MVFFVCSSCGQSIKKNQVEKHYQMQCRSCQYVTCMDCNKDFWGNDYQAHTSCITEDQKYGGKDYKPKPTSNKGEVKQELWIERLRSDAANAKLSPRVSNAIDQLLNCSNIPRKKAKFENFVRNSMRLRDDKLIGEIWDVFSKSISSNSAKPESNNGTTVATNDTATVENSNNSSVTNGVNKRKLEANSTGDSFKCDENGTESAKKKTKHSESNVETVQDTTSDGKKLKFKWTKTVKRLLREKEDKSMTLKKLKKKVWKEYKVFLNDSNTINKEDFFQQLDERVSSCRKVEVEGECVKLV